VAGCRSSASAIHGALSDFSSFHFSCSRITSSTRRVRLCAPRREALTARSVVRHQQVPLRAAQSGTHRVLPPPLGNRRLPKARRGDRFRRARAADQYPQSPLGSRPQKKIVGRNGGPFWSMCANSSTSRALHSSWTEASRGDCNSPRPVIIQRIDKCNTAVDWPVFRRQTRRAAS